MTYQVKDSQGSILASVEIVDPSSASVASTVIATLSLAVGTSVNVSGSESLWVVVYDSSVVTLERV